MSRQALQRLLVPSQAASSLNFPALLDTRLSSPSQPALSSPHALATSDRTDVLTTHTTWNADARTPTKCTSRPRDRIMHP